MAYNQDKIRISIRTESELQVNVVLEILSCWKKSELEFLIFVGTLCAVQDGEMNPIR